VVISLGALGALRQPKPPLLLPTMNPPEERRETNEERLLVFVADFEALAREKFTMEPVGDQYTHQECGGFTAPDGKYYQQFMKSVWPDGFTEYYVERYSINIYDRTVCPNKTAAGRAKKEAAFLYPGVREGRRMVVVGDWSVQYYRRRAAM
jgi:hypothetical protein